MLAFFALFNCNLNWIWFDGIFEIPPNLIDFGEQKKNKSAIERYITKFTTELQKSHYYKIASAIHFAEIDDIK